MKARRVWESLAKATPFSPRTIGARVSKLGVNCPNGAAGTKSFAVESEDT